MRLVTLTERFCKRRQALAPSGEAGKAVGRCAAALARDDLPTVQDAEASMPPSATYWFRRVPDVNLWIWFSFDDERVYLVHLGNKPPVPIDRSSDD